MHIAICDDNIADRKQSERLLGREADRRRNDREAIYIDSYGNTAALLHSPMIYNMFLIDYHSEGKTSLDVIRALREAGVVAPIWVLGSSEPDFLEAYKKESFEDVFYMAKPIVREDLTAAVDKAYEFAALVKPPIEVRGLDDTIYIDADELLYVHCYDKQVEVHRANGDIDTLIGDYDETFHSFENNLRFLLARKRYIINRTFLAKLSLFRITLTNEDSFYIDPVTFFKVKRRIKQGIRSGGHS